MTRRITGAEARELREKATPGPYAYDADPINGMVWVRAPSESDLADVAGERKAATGALLAAAPDLAASLEAVEAERDGLRDKVARLIAAYDDLDLLSARCIDEYEAALAALREAAK